MNVIGHDHIATYCDVKVVLGALGKKNKCNMDLIFCQDPLSLVRAERDNTLNKTVAAAAIVVATALRAVFE
jgi:hypothetical protein